MKLFFEKFLLAILILTNGGTWTEAMWLTFRPIIAGIRQVDTRSVEGKKISFSFWHSTDSKYRPYYNCFAQYVKIHGVDEPRFREWVGHKFLYIPPLLNPKVDTEGLK